MRKRKTETRNTILKRRNSYFENVPMGVGGGMPGAGGKFRGWITWKEGGREVACTRRMLKYCGIKVSEQIYYNIGKAWKENNRKSGSVKKSHEKTGLGRLTTY